jgi:quinohemoprotein ethanol dehydrogenase
VAHRRPTIRHRGDRPLIQRSVILSLTLRSSLLLLAGAFTLLSGCSRDASEKDATPTRFGEIDRERLLAADGQPEQWLTVGGGFGKTHYSALTQINRENVRRLGFAWEYPTATNRGLEATPVVVDGVMYTSGVAGRVYALVAKTGEPLWTFIPKMDMQITRHTCCDQVNRGVAVWRGKVYVAALDGQLYALDARTGGVLWSADTIIDRKRGYSSTGAPQIAGNVVVIGNAGAEYDARGYISAYDLDSGNLSWRFFTVPGDPSQPYEHPELEMAAKTWDPNSRWDVGGGGTVWDGMAYDPILNLLYVGTGNAALYNRAKRSPAGGNNLFLCSILALDPDSGRLVWYYQETPGDQWDYTATQPIILTDLVIHGEPRQVLLHAPKNGFFYVLDRKTGKLLSAEKFAHVTWASHVDLQTGRPVENSAAADYSRGGAKLVFPSFMGAHNWPPMSYSPQTGLVYIPVREAGNLMYDLEPGHTYRAGQGNVGIQHPLAVILDTPEALPKAIQDDLARSGLLKNKPDTRMRAFLRAWDPVEQKLVWEHEVDTWMDHSGVLSTGGGLVFQGSFSGFLRAFDAASGRLLHEIDVGTSIMAAPMTYMIDGVQYIAVMAGLGGGGWIAPDPSSAAYRYGNQGRILAFKLDGGQTPKPALLPPVPPVPEPPKQTASAESIARGEELFERHCAQCHANQPRSAAPDLRRMSRATHEAFSDILLKGLLRPLGMPQWDDLFSPSDVSDIHAYLVHISQLAYEAERRESITSQTGHE